MSREPLCAARPRSSSRTVGGWRWAAAFRAGELSYSHIRLITRITDPLGDTDAVLLQVAKERPVRELEYCIRHYQLRAEQDSPPPRDRVAEDGAFVREVAPGNDQLCLTLPKEEMAEVMGAVDAFIDRSAVEGAADGDREWRHRWDLRRAEAIKEIARAALGAAGRRAEGADRYMTHVVIDLGELLSDKPSVARLLDGTPIVADVARRIACDSTIVVHFVRNGFEVLNLGRNQELHRRPEAGHPGPRSEPVPDPGLRTRSADRRGFAASGLGSAASPRSAAFPIRRDRRVLPSAQPARRRSGRPSTGPAAESAVETRPRSADDLGEGLASEAGGGALEDAGELDPEPLRYISGDAGPSGCPVRAGAIDKAQRGSVAGNRVGELTNKEGDEAWRV